MPYECTIWKIAYVTCLIKLCWNFSEILTFLHYGCIIKMSIIFGMSIIIYMHDLMFTYSLLVTKVAKVECLRKLTCMKWSFIHDFNEMPISEK